MGENPGCQWCRAGHLLVHVAKVGQGWATLQEGSGIACVLRELLGPMRCTLALGQPFDLCYVM